MDSTVSAESFLSVESRSRGGRPHLSPEVRDLIATMSRENGVDETREIVF